MNKEIFMVAIVAVIAVSVIIAMGFEQSEIMEVEDTMNKELRPIEEITPEIQEKLNEIEKENRDHEYTPSEREWITSGPFQIDRSEYVLGEKIFLRIGGLNYDEKGQVVFLKPKNNTHYEVYLSIPFDGADRPAFNYYLQPQLSAIKEHCTVDEFIGDWRVVFRGTDYPNLEFKITEEILPGDEENYQPVC